MKISAAYSVAGLRFIAVSPVISDYDILSVEKGLSDFAAPYC